MGIMEDAKYESRKNGKGKNRSTPLPRTLFTFHPNTSQREALSLRSLDIETNLGMVCDQILSGCSLNVSSGSKGDSFKIILREPHEDWTQAQAISVWHTDLAKCFQGLAYYLEEVNPDWPKLSTPQLFTDEW